MRVLCLVVIVTLTSGNPHPTNRDVPRIRKARSTNQQTSVLINGKFYTVDKQLSDWSLEPQECMVVTGDKIVYIGNKTYAVENYMESGNKVYDLQGNAVLPGFHDIHMHPLEAGSEVAGTCTLNNYDSPESFIDVIKKCAPKQVGTEWVLGFGHSITKLLDHIANGGRDPKYILDDALPNTPAIMLEETSHSVWVNSEALFRAGINKSTGIKPGGVIMRNTSSNEPNGILLENAGIEMMDLALAPTPTLENYNFEGLVYSMNKVSSYGITSLCDARVYWKRGHPKAWEKACNDGKLTARVSLGLWAYPTENDTSQIAQLKNMYSTSNTNCFMNTNQIKFYSDGLLESTTAALLEKYKLDLDLQGLDANVGMNYFTESRLKTYFQELQSFENDEKGFDFHVHAIGDRGVREVLNAFEAAHMDGTRHRLTHIEMITPNDIPRFKNLNVIADFQVAGTFTLPSEYTTHLEGIVGSARTANYMKVKTVLDTGAVTTFSSDWDVSTLDPFVALHHAVDRGSESVTMKQALEMYTIYPAYAMRHENTTGSLEVGKAADFVIINQDVVSIDKSKIKDTKVLATFLAGKSVFMKSGYNLKDVTSEYINSAALTSAPHGLLSLAFVLVIAVAL